MTTAQWLKNATLTLKDAGVGTARLDCLVLLEDELGLEKSQVLASLELPLKQDQLRRLNTKLRRRAVHEPLAYIRKQTEFYGRTFYIDRRVLEPRPESEAMFEILNNLPLTETIIDIGTGSGALAITAKLEHPSCRVVATDIDPDCLAVAAKNAKTYNCDISFIKADLLASLDQVKPSSYLLLANLPYVPDSFQINPAAMREPRIAIFGGPDGLDVYRRFFRAASQTIVRASFILTEVMPPQQTDLRIIAEQAGFKQQRQVDFIQLFS